MTIQIVDIVANTCSEAMSVRITELHITNFRAIRSLQLVDLPDTVVIAGPNGCGKSCVFDALRLLKSVYGGYQPNEWNNWFGEFQINLDQRSPNFSSLMQDRSKPLRISAMVELATNEISFLRDNAETLLGDHFWSIVSPNAARTSPSLAAREWHVHPEVMERVRLSLPDFRASLDRATFEVALDVGLDGHPVIVEALVPALVFSTYNPQNLGIIDFHGANRNYGRERVDQIHLNIEASENKLRSHALYNWSNKYANLKSEMVSSYIRNLLANQVDGSEPVDDSLTATLKELFATFFPGKHYLGPTPTEDGRLLFPVETAYGSRHDIDDLSSGEKEVLYGYLRIRNASPRNSVLLIDEPELHLNPRLVSGLADFYQRHLGQALGSQLWLVTHSDTLIREAVGQPGFGVYHMQAAGDSTDTQENQVREVRITEDFDRVVTDLVGDMAAYRPGAKIVILEGGGADEFDARMVGSLFPELRALVNLVSGGRKNRVSDLYELLRELGDKGKIRDKVFAVVDRDSDSGASAAGRLFRWDVYHLENYLLEPDYIFGVLMSLNIVRRGVESPAEVEAELKRLAPATTGKVIAASLTTHLDRQIREATKLKLNPLSETLGEDSAAAVQQAIANLTLASAEELSEAALREEAAKIRRQVENPAPGRPWHENLQGRALLRAFVGAHAQSKVGYEAFRDLVLARMIEAQFRPAGMGQVVGEILQELR